MLTSLRVNRAKSLLLPLIAGDRTAGSLTSHSYSSSSIAHPSNLFKPRNDRALLAPSSVIVQQFGNGSICSPMVRVCFSSAAEKESAASSEIVVDLYEKMLKSVDKDRSMPPNANLWSLVENCTTREDIQLLFQILQRLRVFRLSNLRIHANFNYHLCMRVTEACARTDATDYGLKALWNHNVYGLTPSIGSAHYLLMYAKEKNDASLMVKIMQVMKENSLPLQPGTADIVFSICYNTNDWALIKKYSQRFLKAGVKLHRTAFDIWMEFAAKRGDAASIWKIEKLRSKALKKHTLASGFSCVKGYLIERNPESAAAAINLLYQETLDWQDCFQSSDDDVRQLSVICIKRHDLCRLIHFRSSLVKLVASQCLLEVLTRISDQNDRKHDKLRCSLSCVESMIAVTEGLVLYGDCTVAMNCAMCLSMMLKWEKPGLQDRGVIKKSKWLRLIVEELVMTLAVPNLASRHVSNQHKSAAHIAVALLRMDKIPQWIRSAFDISCISRIVENISPCNVSAEMVMLLRELMIRKYTSTEQVAQLLHLFQVCRKQVYEQTSKKPFTKQSLGGVVGLPDDTGKVCSMLLHHMVYPLTDNDAIPTENDRLLKEIDMFFHEYSTFS